MDDKGNIKIDELGKKVKKVSGTVTKESKKMQSAWAKSANAIKSNVLGLASMTAAVFAIRGAVKTVLAFEDAMAEVSTIVDTNTVNMHKLNAEILDLSTRVPKDAASLAQGLYQTISAGVTDVGDAMIVLEASSKAATAGLTSTFVAVDAGTTIMNAYGKTVDDITAIQDVLFNTVKEGKTKYDSLATSIGRAAPIAAQVGVSFEELTAAAATLTKGGLSTEEAMTSIRAIMVGILKPTTDAEILAGKLKLQFDSEALAAKGLGGFLEEVTEKTGGNTQAITALFGNVRALTGVMALAGKQAGEFKRIIESNTTAAGVMNEAFGKINETVTSQWQLFKNQFNKTLIETGNQILPTVTSQLKRLNKEAKDTRPFIEQLKGDFENLADPIGNLISLLGPAKTNLENLATPIKDLTTLFDGMGKSVDELLSGPKFSDFFKADPGEIKRTDDLISKAMAAHKLLDEAGGGPGGLTKQQQTILDIKKEILAAEQTSKLVQIAINQIEAERIANAKALFGEVEKTGMLFTEEGGIVSGMRESRQEMENMLVPVNALEISFDEITGEMMLVARGTKDINAEFDKLNPKIKLAGSNTKGWADSTSELNQRLFQAASALNQILQLGTGARKVSLSGILQLGATIAGFIPGGQAIAAGLQLGSIATRGLQHGGDFTVGGSGGADSQLVMFRASPRETVSVKPPGVGGGGGDINISPTINVSGSGLTKSEVMEAARPGIDLIASGVKKAISNRQITRKDLAKAV